MDRITSKVKYEGLDPEKNQLTSAFDLLLTVPMHNFTTSVVVLVYCNLLLFLFSMTVLSFTCCRSVF